MLVRVLICCPGHSRIARLLDGKNLLVRSKTHPNQLFQTLGSEPFDFLILQEQNLAALPTDWVRTVRTMPEPPEIVLMVEVEDAEQRAHWLSLGVLAVLNQNLSDALLQQTLKTLVQRKRMVGSQTPREPTLPVQLGLTDFTSANSKMRQVLNLARTVASVDSTLLVTGETGVGKEWLAQAIHQSSPRAAYRFVAVNCAAIPESLLESELFGHERGAFTGAQKARRGFFEMAHQGTLFLDEIGDLPQHLQVKLLRALQDRTIQPLGSEQAFRVNVRVVAATHRNLNESIKNGTFRPDLYYRLSVVSLEVPPLRQRTEDIPNLVNGCLEQFNAQFKKAISRISPAAMAALQAYSWPGNVRELINVMERTVLLCQGSEITPGDLPETVSAEWREHARQMGNASFPDLNYELPIKELLGSWTLRLEQTYLKHWLQENAGNLGVTARQAGLETRTLYNKMKKWGWDKKQFKKMNSDRG